MSAVPLTRMLPLRFLTHLLLLSFIPLYFCMEFSEDARNIEKIRRGNQWAIGHFMGKKSLQDTYNPSEQDMDSEDFRPRIIEMIRGTFRQEPIRALSPRKQDEIQWMLKKIMDDYIKTTQK
ncbi:neuromedin-B precursor [Xenopus laevis]|uniref:Neuromedin-B n=2 Tax=Xenopus laevis TaxID=8355 RepID=NMB_XENLA|nr:neuromedin-B precursor [Xenopus laevis]P43443.1 RecName: Full=Neuromedin-B; Flags: Precursor [Xenopus laevis]AAA49912.1 neuromedin [Xenopus laevis]OCT87128.1 hypothetical protein XELAEV_18020822mg [Xenopus laevis]